MYENKQTKPTIRFLYERPTWSCMCQPYAFSFISVRQTKVNISTIYPRTIHKIMDRSGTVISYGHIKKYKLEV